MARDGGKVVAIEKRLPVEQIAARLKALHGTSGALARVWARARTAREQDDRAALRMCARLLDAIVGLRR